MEIQRARSLLEAERIRVAGLLADTTLDDQDDRLQARPAAIVRAERRIEEGTYGYSIRRGVPIPDARLEADPAAEFTVEKAKDL